MKSMDENTVFFEPVYQLCRATEHLTIREIFPASPPRAKPYNLELHNKFLSKKISIFSFRYIYLLTAHVQ